VRQRRFTYALEREGEDRKREERERRKKVAPVQFYHKSSDVTKSRCVLWRDW
jgi:hypothetical protein